ncbi:MAG: hypothetical protein MZV65_49040 [Chromatiales bacterium]|nr:hypothetical protein [Chromatiales bacterium]
MRSLTRTLARAEHRRVAAGVRARRTGPDHAALRPRRQRGRDRLRPVRGVRRQRDR